LTFAGLTRLKGNSRVSVGPKTSLPLALALSITACAFPSGNEQNDGPDLPEKDPPTVVLETTMGRIVLELRPNRAPNTVNHFLRHVRAGFYDKLAFHRVIPETLVQAGRMTKERHVRRSPAPDLASEANNGLSNRRGSVAMARVAGRPHTAKTQFFINLAHNTVLDFTDKETDRGWGYTVFGRVVEGMSVVDLIGAMSVVEEGKPREFWPLVPVVIDTAYLMRVEPTAVDMEPDR
jgi:cyclophilin family peptidyl-prolyl cis-trans isomerase